MVIITVLLPLQTICMHEPQQLPPKCFKVYLASFTTASILATAPAAKAFSVARSTVRFFPASPAMAGCEATSLKCLEEKGVQNWN